MIINGAITKKEINMIDKPIQRILLNINEEIAFVIVLKILKSKLANKKQINKIGRKIKLKMMAEIKSEINLEITTSWKFFALKNLEINGIRSSFLVIKRNKVKHSKMVIISIKIFNNKLFFSFLIYFFFEINEINIVINNGINNKAEVHFVAIENPKNIHPIYISLFLLDSKYLIK